MKSLEAECFGPSFYEDFQSKLHEKGIKMAYPQIRYALKTFNLYRKNEKKESEAVISKLLALHIAQVKMEPQRRIVYVDMANIRLTPTHLVIGTPTPKTNSGLHMQIAICEQEGLLGYQIYSTLPPSTDQFIQKLAKKHKLRSATTIVMPHTDSRVQLKQKVIELYGEAIN